jgi:EAL domain-containing protein (putative c-di-GMP-specific phosphodiesterase class I)
MRKSLQWHRDGIFHGTVALNVSAKQLIHSNFLDDLLFVVEQTRCMSSMIELEITESSILENPEKTIALLGVLKNRGFKISIDDFGTGYSSLSYLKNLPIDKIKIDISFITNISHEPKNQTIVSAIIALAKGLNITVLAEGVETKEELEFLCEKGINSIQGYCYYKPLNIESFETILIK